nr:solute carrier family 25 member 45 [Pelodiscus sinensis]XP_014435802.1 solute carrier family 25 member 45 [Pelodiscus sinensis]XP_025033969.1 solute carrier family 25 member 45 [Pelodiscus sinensis]|eukprot:XP_014435801.1 solute carrier family 25 member 45 [Pelodiscus sinensis]
MSVAEFVAGWISGAVGLALGHPVDTVKVRLQTQSGYRGILDCVMRTYRNETVRGFFKGMSFPLLSVAVANSVIFGAYSNALLYLTATHHRDRSTNPPSYAHILTAGCFSGLMQAVVLAPVDLIKVRLQNQTHPYWLRSPAMGPGAHYRGPLHCGVSIFRKEGVLGLFRGTWALVLRDTPTMPIYFLTYVSLCQAVTAQGREPGPITVLVAGGCAGTASWALATPMDVIKARLQMDGMKGVSYRGVLDCIHTSIRHEGPQVFLKGLSLNSIRAFPVNAVTFLSYENILKLLC